MNGGAPTALRPSRSLTSYSCSASTHSVNPDAIAQFLLVSA